MVTAIQTFNKTVKRNFRRDSPGPFPFRVSGLQSIGREPPRVQFSKDEMVAIFRPVVDEVIALVRDQIRHVQLNNHQATKHILMVGGFGRSGYLVERLEEVFGPGVGIIESLRP